MVRKDMTICTFAMNMKYHFLALEVSQDYGDTQIRKIINPQY